MPELPEIITIRNDLRKEILGKRIVNIKKHPNYNFDSKKVLSQSVEEISNIAKLLLIKLSSGDYIATHLNMTGLLLFNNPDPYVKVSLTFDSGDVLDYSDVRMFGYFEVWDENKVAEYRKRYGKTALDEDLSQNEFLKLIKKKNVPIKNVLLDQKIVSGIGNIYANDALYMSKINPHRKASSLEDSELVELFKNVREILNEGIKNRGSTIDRYRDLYGKPGFQQDFFRIYGKRGQKCKVCGGEISYEKMQGRPTFYCEICQPLETTLKLL